MVDINRLREFLAETKEAISEINYTQLVADDSELEKFMQERKASDNTLLFGVLPEFQLRGTENAAKWNNQLLFFLVEKCNDKNLTHDMYLDVFARTQNVVRKFVAKIISDKEDQVLLGCSLMRELDESSIDVSLVWRKAQCNGWMITFDLFSMP